jgi:hypothetical protein
VRPLVTAVLLLIVFAAPAQAQTQTGGSFTQPPVMLVVDTSGSMGDDDGNGTTKIDGAKLALLDYVGSVEAGAPIGLRTYPGGTSGCDSGRLAIPVGPANPENMSAQIRALEADGDTPTAEAMRQAVKDLKASGADRGTLVIVSDGESTCDDPCEAAKEIHKQGFDLDTITVGFQISDEGREELNCISDALDGRYLDIDQSDELRDTLDRLGRPKMQIRLDGSTSPQAVAGGDYVDIAATVTNAGEVEAQDVIGQLTFAASGVDVRRPVSRLGNLAPHQSRQITWRVRAAPSVAGRKVDFTAVGRATNASASGVARGSLSAIAVTRADQAGDILKGPGKRIAIVGDSYSAGEGTDSYVTGTDTGDNGCHRSQLTYLTPVFGEHEIKNIACSGAITSDLFGANQRNSDEPAQSTQLADAQKSDGPVKAVVMTIGGNDAQFGGIAFSCIAGPKSCTTRMYPKLPGSLESQPTAEFVEEDLSHDFSQSLVGSYEEVNRGLNNEDAVKKRGRAAPILVLAYPLPLPLKGRSCAAMGSYRVLLKTVYLLTAGEIDFLTGFATKLNGEVEAAVETARLDRGIPVFYVPNTEMAFQPRHTFCDEGNKGSASEPYARSLATLNAGTVSARTIINLSKGGGPYVRAAAAAFALGGVAATRGVQEIAHPNPAGYGAETLAILRWSRSQAALQAVEFTKTAEPEPDPPTTWNSADVNLGQLDGAQTPTIQGGSSYPLTVDGFAPNLPVRVEIHSRTKVLADVVADERGRVDIRVFIPEGLSKGRHEIAVDGSDPNGNSRRIVVPVNYEKPFRVTFTAGLGALSGLSLLLGIVLLGATGVLGGWRNVWRGSGRER